MARYIDADALIANKFKNDISYNAFCGLIKRQQTADVRPNSHGKWEERRVESTEIWDTRRFYCSVCGDWQTYGTPAFCPNCGADMRGDQK